MEKRARIYQIRQNILKALKEFDMPCSANDVKDYPGFLFLRPGDDEIREQWLELRQNGYIAACEGFDGEYCIPTQAGVRQIQPEFAKDVFVWGPRALRGYGLVVALAAAILLSGCATETATTYYESGQLKSEYRREGFVSWSDGDGKIINLPLANPSISGVGK